MKIKFLYLVLFLGLIKTANAQKGLRFEIYLMPGFTFGDNLSISDTANNFPTFQKMNKKPTIIIDWGAELSYFFANGSGIGIGLTNAHHGQNYDYTFADYPITDNKSISLHYLKIPIQWHYVSNDQSRSISLAAGFYVGQLLNYEYKHEFNFGDSLVITETVTGKEITTSLKGVLGNYTTYNTIKEELFKDTDVGLTLSIGIEYKLTTRISIPLYLNYQHGLININNVYGLNSSIFNNDKYRNKALLGRVGLLFKLW